MTNIGAAPTNRLEKLNTPVRNNRSFRLRAPQVTDQATLEFRIDSIEALGGNHVRLAFFAFSNKSFTVQYKEELHAPSWSDLSSVSPAPTNRTITINTTLSAAKRFFRVRAS